MCSATGLQKRFKESLNPGREFERSLSPEDALKDSFEPIVGPDVEIQEPEAVKPPQASKKPDVSILQRRNSKRDGMGVGMSTLLTSPSGVGTPAIGTSSLLGG